MTIDLFINRKNPKQLIKQTNIFFNYPEKNKEIVFSFVNYNFVIAIYKTKIRISLAEHCVTDNDYYLIFKYISYITKNETVIISYNHVDYYFNSGKINLEKIWGYTYENIKNKSK